MSKNNNHLVQYMGAKIPMPKKFHIPLNLNSRLDGYVYLYREDI